MVQTLVSPNFNRLIESLRDVNGQISRWHSSNYKGGLPAGLLASLEVLNKRLNKVLEEDIGFEL